MKVLVVYYSMYGRVYDLARAVEEGAKSVAGAEVTVRKVQEFEAALKSTENNQRPRRAGDHAFDHDPAYPSPWHDLRGRAVFREGAAAHRRTRRHAVRYQHDRRADERSSVREENKTIARALGKRIAEIAKKLRG